MWHRSLYESVDRFVRSRYGRESTKYVSEAEINYGDYTSRREHVQSLFRHQWGKLVPRRERFPLVSSFGNYGVCIGLWTHEQY
jgi:hypothetical protein